MEKEQIVKELIKIIGDNPNREGLKDTPKRVIKMFSELFKGYDIKQRPIITTFNNGKDGISYDEMITDTGELFSFCEHHMLPFTGKYYFSYIPHPKGKLLGLSKIGRVVDFFASKLQIQERLTHEIISYINYCLCNSNCKYKPIGMALTIECEHLCKTMRGVKKKGMMRTTKLLGVFQTNVAARHEYISWVNKGG